MPSCIMISVNSSLKSALFSENLTQACKPFLPNLHPSELPIIIIHRYFLWIIIIIIVIIIIILLNSFTLYLISPFTIYSNFFGSPIQSL